MSPEDFIRKNIIQKLKELDYQGGHYNLLLMKVLRITVDAHRQVSVAPCLMIAFMWQRFGWISTAVTQRLSLNAVGKQ
ncbi:hypothetical protein PROVRETT_05498 [Providencia rettgeri DSM 1131]|uniref:hypothetical protein n=1 Tax=Providencia rettgeri TaxID=587 RepID=UPI000197C48C|nr:hypothetical protein [Providencia rettgeri]EFE55846.1 hypothetical protein PROVRETT_05498 [Providencia rettgeri DSM 1131]QXA59937.1 hypothetical protein I6L79_10775 [Providencia rettgeri]